VWRVLATVSVLVAAAGATYGVVRNTEAHEPSRLPATEMPGRLLVGFQDDPTLRWGDDRLAMLGRARRARAAVVRTTVDWSKAAPVRPADPKAAFDPAYRLEDVDELARNAQARGMELLLTIWGTPGWANGGHEPNTAPTRPAALAAFSEALADRYSGRHPGYPAVRLFSAWNEPNLELFLSPQFDAEGRSVAPAAYARMARAVVEGVRSGNPDALVAVGGTSARGRDYPAPGSGQESHSPGRFAELVAAADPDLPFDAWAQHPYPTRPGNPPSEPAFWPGVGLTSLERFGRELDGWFGRERVPLWITEYGHETTPGEPLGVSPAAQARFARESLWAAAGNPRIRMFIWFVLRDSPGNPWQSGLIDAAGRLKPAWYTFSGSARVLDGRNPSVESDASRILVPALELAYHNPAGTEIDVDVDGRKVTSPLREDGWLEVALDGERQARLEVTATDSGGRSVSRVVRLQP
jgi:hypothetical protein